MSGWSNCRPDGKKEVIDFRLASAESPAQWEQFLLAALPTAFPAIPVQRCWTHKIRNVLNKVRKADQPALKSDLHRIMNANTLPAAWSAARRFADRWERTYG